MRNVHHTSKDMRKTLKRGSIDDNKCNVTTRSQTLANGGVKGKEFIRRKPKLVKIKLHGRWMFYNAHHIRTMRNCKVVIEKCKSIT